MELGYRLEVATPIPGTHKYHWSCVEDFIHTNLILAIQAGREFIRNNPLTDGYLRVCGKAVRIFPDVARKVRVWHNNQTVEV